MADAVWIPVIASLLGVMAADAALEGSWGYAFASFLAATPFAWMFIEEFRGGRQKPRDSMYNPNIQRKWSKDDGPAEKEFRMSFMRQRNRAREEGRTGDQHLPVHEPQMR